jgi:H+/gluconate symporter-like permease
LGPNYVHLYWHRGTYLCKSIHKATAGGEVFDYGTVAFTPPSPDRQYPGFLISLLPLIVVIVVFNVISNLIPALALGFVLSLVLFRGSVLPTHEKSRYRTIIHTLNVGGRSAAEALLLGGSVVGFASVVQATSAYDVLVKGLLELNVPESLLVLISDAILVGLTGSPPAGLTIVVPVLSEALALPPEAIHRIATTASTTSDTLPFQGAVIIMMNMAGLNHKEGYPSVFMCTIVWTSVASILVANLFMLFSALA